MRIELIAIGAGVLAAAAPAAAGVVNFSAHGTPLRVNLPDAYCPPVTAAHQAVARQTAAADPANLTLVTSLKCGPEAEAWTDYYLLKTPKQAQTKETSRAELMASLGPQFAAMDSAAVLAQSQKGIRDAFGGGVEQTGGGVVPAGRDDVCGYLSGVIGVRNAQREFKVTVTVCITMIKGRIITINHNKLGMPLGSQAGRLAVVRAIAEGMIADNET